MNPMTPHSPTAPSAWAPFRQRALRHPVPALFFWLAACVLLPLLLSGCLGGGDDPATPPPAASSAVIGPAGGTLVGPDGVQVVVPAGALASSTTLTITRSSAGAPTLTGSLQPAGGVYEFTPHGLVFGSPVTLTFPLPTGSIPGATTTVFMASPGDADWSGQEATIVDGKALVQRNRFSWGMLNGCAWTEPAPDSGCVVSSGATHVSATPTAALVPIGFTGVPVDAQGYLQNFELTQAAPLTFRIRYSAVRDCHSGTLQLFRQGVDPVYHTMIGTRELVQTIGAPMLEHTGTAPFMRSSGTATFAPVTVDHHANGQWLYTTVHRCTAPNGATKGGSDAKFFVVSVPVPTVTHTIGGNVSGLTGSGLVLQNNGGDNLAVGADGAFTFATPVGSGNPYSVTILTQPTGQTCSVSSGSGTASANVTSVAVSCSGVRSWQTATLLETSNLGYADGVEVALNASGDGMAVWSQSNGSTTDIWARRYTVAGGWGTAQLIETTSGDAAQPHVAVDAAGNAVAVWSQQSTTLYNLFANRFNAATAQWGSEALLETDAGQAYAPRVTFLASGDALAVWSQGQGAPTIQAVRLVAGTWGSAQTISGGTGAAYQPQVAALGNTAIATWVQDNGGQDHIFFNTFNGTGWSTADWLSDPANANGSTEAPRIASDGSGRALVVWSQSDGTDTNVYHRLYQSGSWGAVAALDTAGAPYAVSPRVAMNASGQAVVGWTEGVADGGHPWVRSWSPATGWDGATPIDTALSAARGDAPAVAIDGAGNVIAVWSTEVSSISADLYAIHRSAAGSWGSPVLLETGSASAMAPKVVADPAGRAIAVWNQAEAGFESIWAALFR